MIAEEKIRAFRARLITKLEVADARSRKVIWNILLSFGAKGGSIIVGLILIPITINYINPTEYGIWLTISSLIGWMSFFDVGMGNGLRNKLATSLALNQYEEAKIYVSTSYAILAIISLSIFLITFIINPLIDWRQFLNIPRSVPGNIPLILMVVVGGFCIQFVVQLLNIILTANQEPAYSSIITFLGQAALLLSIVYLKYNVAADLLTLVVALTFVPIFILIVSSAILFQKRLKHLSPSFDKINLAYARSILRLGGAFFIIQIGTIVLFQTNNIIIAKVIGQEAVTQFNVAYKLYSVLIMIFAIVMTPYWSAFTDAFAKKDYEWAKKSMKNLRRFYYLISFVCIPVIILFSGFLFKIWIGSTVFISFSLSLMMGLYSICYNGLALSCFFLNGIGKLRIQLILYLIVGIINIPAGVFLGRVIGVTGVVLSNVIFMVFMVFILWIQVNKILNSNAKGVWDK